MPNIETHDNQYEKGFADGLHDGHGEGVAILLQPLKDAVSDLEASRLKDSASVLKRARAAIAKAESFHPGAQPTPTIAVIIADMLAWEAEQFDGRVDCPKCGGSGTLVAEGEDPNACDQCGGEGQVGPHDLSVSGADLVDAFTAWRGQLRVALAGAHSGIPPSLHDQVLSALELGASYLSIAMEDQDSGVEEGIYDDDPTITADHAAHQAQITAAMEALKAMEDRP